MRFLNVLRTALVIRLLDVVAADNGRQCGTFVLDCDGAEGYCNNACYHTKCVADGKGTEHIVFTGQDTPDTVATNVWNLEQAGARTNGTDANSPCNMKPFAQLLTDQQKMKEPGNYVCALWPPMIHTQNAFQPGKVRNSLRCVPDTQLSTARQRLRDYITDKDGQRGVCYGTLQKGDKFDVSFDIGKVKDKNKVPYCAPNPDCTNFGGYQFHLTSKPTEQGSISVHYKPGPMTDSAKEEYGQDNHYAVTNTDFGDIAQCELVCQRGTTDGSFIMYFRPPEAVITFRWIQSKTFIMTDNFGSRVFAPSESGLKLQLKMALQGPRGSLIQFEYGKPGDPAHMLWTTNSTGEGLWGYTGANVELGLHNNYCPQLGDGERIWCNFPCYNGTSRPNLIYRGLDHKDEVERRSFGFGALSKFDFLEARSDG